MGWLQKRRERKARALAEACRIAVAQMQAPVDPKAEALDMLKLINELGRGRLEVIKLDNELERERLRMEAEDRKLRRQEEQEQKEKDRARREKQAIEAREARAREKIHRSVKGRVKTTDLDAEMANCEDCIAAIEGRKERHTFDMLKHAEHGHKFKLAQILQRQGEADGTPAN
jgi:hypothetical protein